MLIFILLLPPYAIIIFRFTADTPLLFFDIVAIRYCFIITPDFRFYVFAAHYAYHFIISFSFRLFFFFFYELIAYRLIYYARCAARARCAQCV